MLEQQHFALRSLPVSFGVHLDQGFGPVVVYLSVIVALYLWPTRVRSA